MKTRSQWFGLLALLAAAGLLYGAWLAVRAHRDLVTLNVRNMEVRQVVKKIEWQTWESITLDKNVQGKVTLNVRKVPLEEVLRIMGDQTSSRWSVIYPLYSGGRSLALLKQALRGELDPATHGWTNLQGRGFFRGGPMFGGRGGPLGGPDANPSQRVSLQIRNKDLPFVTLAFSRFAQARVVPEDGTRANVNLTLNQATVPEAVAQLAKQVRRSWTKLYLLNAEFGPGGPDGPGGRGGPPQFARREGRDGFDPREPGGPGEPGERPPFARREDTNSFEAQGTGGASPAEQMMARREEFRRQREALEEELKQALPAAERQRLEAAQQQREQQFREMRNLTPEQRRERFGQRGGAEMSRRNLERIKNTTPEQRAEQYRRMREMRNRFEQRQQPSPPQQPPSR